MRPQIARRTQGWLAEGFAVVWFALGIHPRDRQDWLLDSDRAGVWHVWPAAAHASD